MGKLLVLSLSDCEEHIFNRIMAAIIDEPALDHIALPLSDAILSFPNIEIRLKEQTVSCRGQLVTFWPVTLAGYSPPVRFMRPYGIEMENLVELLLPVSSVRFAAS